MKKCLTFLITVLLTFSGTLTAQSAYNGIDPAIAGTFSIYMCETPEQLDCIESVEVKPAGQEEYLPATYLETRVNDLKKDKLGNKDHTGAVAFSFQAEQITNYFTVNAYLSTPKRKLVKEIGTPSFAGSFAIWINGDQADLSTNVRVVARTSWFKPVAVSIFAAEPEFEYSKITGGNRWTFSGTRTIQSSYENNWSKKMATGANADLDDTRFFFGAEHAGKNMNESYYDPRCASKGFTVQATNATSAGQATWNPSTRALEFNIGAPHRDTKGAPVKGFFRLWVSKAYMQCMWPNSGLDKASKFTVGVYNENGSKQVATTVVRYAKSELSVAAYNFHYSAPTIRVKAKK